MTHLAGKVLVITGASSGIGEATAVAAAREGLQLVLNARREDRLRSVADRVVSMGGEVAVVTGDVTTPGISEAMLDEAGSRFGRLDAVFSNAGYSLNKPVLETTDEELRRMLDVNFLAGVELLRLAARRLLAAGRPGHLLMCSSCLSKFALPDHAAYAATKAAQHAVCSAMRHELAGSGVYVSSVHPITTTTELTQVAAALRGREPPPEGRPRHAPAFFVQKPERVARAVIRCLRRPCPEVWTSFTVRTVAGLMTMFPRFYELAMKMQGGKGSSRAGG